MKSGPNSMGEEINLRELGLHKIQSSGSNLHIIFVHGVLSNSETAWGNPSWPKITSEDFDANKASIYVFSYRTSLISRTYSVFDVANALKESFDSSELWDKRIVFVCHSMGGIVVRRFLVANEHALAQSGGKVGLFLVASPSLGSSDANNLALLISVARHTQGSILRFSQDNTELYALDYDFRQLLHRKAFLLIGREIYEDRPIKLKRWLGMWTQVVEPFAAAAYFHGSIKVPGSDHSTIAAPLRREAFQNDALKRFIADFQDKAQREPIKDKSESAELDLDTSSERLQLPVKLVKCAETDIDELSLLKAAVQPNGFLTVDLLKKNADVTLVAKAALHLSSGRMLERLIASELVSGHDDPAAVFRSAVRISEDESKFQRSATWLRFIKNDNEIDLAFEAFLSKCAPNEADNLRMRSRMLGWAGKGYFPIVDFQDAWISEKLSFYYATAYLHCCWSDQSVENLGRLVRYGISAAHHYEGYYKYKITFLQWLSALNGVPAKNTRVMLDQMFSAGAPPQMVEALLYRAAIDSDFNSNLEITKFVFHKDTAVQNAALNALACIPANTDAKLLEKYDLIKRGSPSFMLAAGVDKKTEEVDQLSSVLAANAGNELSYNAAWALGQIAHSSPEALITLQKEANDHKDKIVRAICIAGLAKCNHASSIDLIRVEETDAQDLESFCLCIAKSYAGDTVPLFKLLNKTPEDRLYVPYLFLCFQMMYREAIDCASVKYPFLMRLKQCSDAA